MFKLSEFATSINTRGILKNNKYIATIAIGGNHYLSSQIGQGDTRLFSIRCDSVQLPGVSIASADGPPRLGYGPIEKNPYSANFEDIALTFIVDANSAIHKMLYSWVNVIVNFSSSRGLTETRNSTVSPMNNSAAYEVGYRDRYATEMKIEVYKDVGENTHQKSMTYTLYKAFPMGFPSNGLNWNEGDVLRLNIPFAYTDYSVEYHS
jgi:hypothetical protein